MKKHIPNTITCLNLISGCNATYLAFQNKFEWALLMIVVGAVFDFFDGMVARLLHVSSPIGKELDSLADFVNFGVAPAMLMYFWCLSGQPQMPHHMKNLLLGSALFYALCDAFRLARFNTMLEQPTIPYWKNFFLGVPAPGGCWMVLTPVILALAFTAKDTAPLVSSTLQNPWFGLSMLLFIGVLMASRLPTISLKSVYISPPISCRPRRGASC